MKTFQEEYEEILGLLNVEHDEHRADKKKLVAVGVNTKTNECICIYSEATYDMLKQNYGLYVKEYSATNWNGRDNLERTLRLNKLSLTANYFEHSETVRGADQDMGHRYDWSFTFDRVCEVKRV